MENEKCTPPCFQLETLQTVVANLREENAFLRAETAAMKASIKDISDSVKSISVAVDGIMKELAKAAGGWKVLTILGGAMIALLSVANGWLK